MEKKLTWKEVEGFKGVLFAVETAYEDMEPEKMIDESMSEEIKSIHDRLEQGDLWAWCVAMVHCKVADLAILEDLRGSAVVGGCNYESEDDFRKGALCQELCHESFDELMDKLEAAVKALNHIKVDLG